MVIRPNNSSSIAQITIGIGDEPVTGMLPAVGPDEPSPPDGVGVNDPMGVDDDDAETGVVVVVVVVVVVAPGNVVVVVVGLVVVVAAMVVVVVDEVVVEVVVVVVGVSSTCQANVTGPVVDTVTAIVVYQYSSVTPSNVHARPTLYEPLGTSMPPATSAAKLNGCSKLPAVMMPVVGAVLRLTCWAFPVWANSGNLNVTPAGAIGPPALYCSCDTSTDAGTMKVLTR